MNGKSIDDLIKIQHDTIQSILLKYKKNCKRWTSTQIQVYRSHIEQYNMLIRAKACKRYLGSFFACRNIQQKKSLLVALAQILSYLTGIKRDREAARVGNHAFFFIEIHWDVFEPHIKTLMVENLPNDEMNLYIDNIKFEVNKSGKVKLGLSRIKKMSSSDVIQHYEEEKQRMNDFTLLDINSLLNIKYDIN